MEIYVMKKKFVLILALALVSSMAFATFNFGGEALVGYKFDLANGGSVSTYGYDNTVGYFYMNATSDYAKVAFRGDFVSSSSLTGSASSYNYEETDIQLSLYLDKALAEKEIELPVSLTAYIGNAALGGFYSYADPSGIVDDNYDWFQANDRSTYPIGVDVGYEGFTFRAMANIVDTEMSPLFSVKGTVVDGISFAASYVGNSVYVSGDSEVNLSATADLAALADLDFSLSGSVFTVLGIGSASDSPIILAAVKGGKDAVSAYAEFSLNAVDAGADTIGIYAGGSYALTDLVTVGADCGYDVDGAVFSYSGYAKSTIGGVTYKAKLGGDTDGALYIKTQAYISF
jgi:hypothetical protein